MSTIAEDDVRVVAGVDTHKEFHVVVVLDELGRKLDMATFAATPRGYRELTGGSPTSVRCSPSASKAPVRGERGCAGTCESAVST